MSLNNLLNVFLPVFSIVISLAIVVGGFVAFRQGFFKQSSEIQGQTIDALKIRVETLESQVESDEKELDRLRQLISTIRHALARRGLRIEIQGTFVTLIDDGGGASTSPASRPQPPKKPTAGGKVRSIKLTSIDDDDDDDAIS